MITGWGVVSGCCHDAELSSCSRGYIPNKVESIYYVAVYRKSLWPWSRTTCIKNSEGKTFFFILNITWIIDLKHFFQFTNLSKTTVLSAVRTWECIIRNHSHDSCCKESQNFMCIHDNFYINIVVRPAMRSAKYQAGWNDLESWPLPLWLSW